MIFVALIIRYLIMANIHYGVMFFYLSCQLNIRYSAFYRLFVLNINKCHILFNYLVTIF